MSSILDALRKLEEEKAHHQSAAPSAYPVDPGVMDPVPRRGRSRRPRRRSTSERPLAVQVAWVAVPLGVFVLGVGGAAFWNTSPSEPDRSANVAALSDAEPNSSMSLMDQRDAQIERVAADLRDAAMPIPDAEPFAEAAVEVEPEAETPEPAPTSDAVVSNSIAPRSVEVVPVPRETVPEPEPMPVEEPAPVPVAEPEPAPIEYEYEYEEPEPIQVAESREPEVVEEFEPYEPPPAPEPERGPSEGFRRAMEVQEAVAQTEFEDEPVASAPVEEDIRRYDIMTRTVLARLNIPEMKINMLMQPNERNPLAAALIDYNKVYVGEAIPNTQGRAHLIGVDIRGIAIEVEGDRYYYPK